MSRRNPSKKELELSEQAKRKVVEQYGLDVEDYEDLMRMGPPPPGGRMTFDGIPDILGQATYRRSSPAEDAKLREWNKRLSELKARKRKRDEERKRTEEERVQRQADDFAATIRGEETPTQKEARQRAEAAVSSVNQPAQVQAQTTAPAAQVALPAGPTSGSGDRQGSRPLQRRGIYGGVGKDSSKRNTLEVNNMRLIPSTENRNLVNELQRRQLLDAPTGVDVTSPLYTNAEVRLMRRQAAQNQMYTDRMTRLQKIEDAARSRADVRARTNGSLRGERDWKYYGTVANEGGDGWKKGGKEYTDAMSALRDKMKTLTDLADTGLLHANEQELRQDVRGQYYVYDLGNPRQRMSSLYGMIDKSDSGSGLSQKQIEVANAQLDRLLDTANKRKGMRDAKEAHRINMLREDLGLAEGTSASAVLKADQDRRNSAINGALVALGNPETWNSPGYYDQLEALRTNGVGLASAFSSAMKDPAMRDAYNADVQRLRSMPNSDVDLAELQNKYAVVGLQRQRGLGELNLRPTPVGTGGEYAGDQVLDDMGAPLGQEQVTIRPKAAPQQTLTNEQKRALGIQAAREAGDVLRPRKGVL